MAVSTSSSIFLISLLAIPLTYTVNTIQSSNGDWHREWTLFLFGVGSLSLICVFVYFAVRNKGHQTDPLLYVWILGTFSSVCDLIIGLENDDIVSGFMTEYLRDGEPYLKTAHGHFICWWDGVGHYAMYMMILAAMSYNQSFREVGLYWAGSIGHSMIVFMPGNIVGKYGLRWSFLLNVPYCIFPFLCGARFLSERPQSTSESKSPRSSIWKRPGDLFFILGLVLSTGIALFRCFAALGCSQALFKGYISDVEPYLEDPVAYPKIQMLEYFFHFVPYYCCAIYGMLYPGQAWMSDWSLIHAGAAAQAQVAHIGASIHHRTPYALRVPPTKFASRTFWAVNLFLLIFPQLLAFRVFRSDSEVTPTKEKRQ